MEAWNLERPVTAFLDELASKSSTPGGGSAAALTGAMGAALISMVCRLTLGRPRFAAAEAIMQTTLDRAEALRQELQTLTEEDVAAFRRLSAAYTLPRVTDADTAIRRDAMQAALRRATEVPLRTARAALALLPLAQPVIEQGNPSAVSDVGAAIYLAQTAARASLLNVDINLRTLEDQRFVREVRAEVERLTDGLPSEVERLVGLVQDRIRG